MPVENPKSKKDDTAFTIGSDGVMPMGALADDTSPDSVDEGDIGIPRMTLTRILRVAPTDAGGGNLGKAEDAAHTSGDYGIMALAVRSDAATALAAAGDYIPIIVDASGRLHIAPAPANSGVDIGDVDVLSIAAGDNNIGNVDIVTLPAGNLGQQAMAASLSTVPANNITDATYIGDIKFGEGLPANSGVDIGDVDVTSVIPGTGATNLGKAVDAAAGATDTGVTPLAVRDDALGGLTPIEGDYVPLRTDANGALWTHDDALDAALSGSELQVDVVAALPAGTNAIGKLAANSGVDIGDVDVLSIAAGANIIGKVGIDQTTPGTTNGVQVNAALPAGTNAIGKLAANSGVDIGDVDVTSIIPGTGATNLGKAVDSVAAATDTGVAPLAVRDDALAALTPIEGDYVPLRTDANGAVWTHDDALDAALSGSELQVDVVAALPAGTNAIGRLAANSGIDIGDVDVLSIAAGANIIGKVGIDQTTPGTTNKVQPNTGEGASGDAQPNSIVRIVDANGNPAIVEVRQQIYNGTTWDRPRTVASSGAGLGVLQVGTLGELITLAASAARTSGANGTAVTGLGWRNRYIILCDITASATDAADTLDVYIDVSLDGTTWLNAVHFTQQAGNGAARKEFAVLDPSAPGTAVINVTSDAAAAAVRPAMFGPQMRARWAIVDSGDANQSHTFSVVAYAI